MSNIKIIPKKKIILKTNDKINLIILQFLILKQRQVQQKTMQVTNSRKQTKQKQFNHQIPSPSYSISSTTRPFNPNHCRSLVQLNTINTNSAQKQNKNHQLYSSIVSNQDNKVIHGNKTNNCNYGNGNTKQPLANSKNISNIAKILLNANTSKSKQQADSTKTNSLIQTSSTPHSISQNGSIKNKIIGSQQKKNELFSNIPTNQSKIQTKISSQSQIKDHNTQNNNYLKHNNNIQQRYQLSIQKQNNNEKQNRKEQKKQMDKKQQNKQYQDYNLIIKLKQYIKNLKQNQIKYFQHIKQLTQQINLFKQQSIILKQKIQGYQIRQKSILKKLKTQQYLINDLKNIQKNNQYNNNNHNFKNQCHQHQLIIQSLKNVINQQMNKIIQLQTFKVQLQQQKHRNSFSKQQRQYHIKNIQNDYKQKQIEHNHQKNRQKFHQIYSFKKRNNLNDESIYIDDENENKNYEEYLNRQQLKKQKNIYNTIPQPYNQLIKSLKSDSRIQNKNIQKQTNQSDIQYQKSLQSDNSQQDHQQNQDDLNVKNQTQSSDHSVLQEVGQYLSYIRKNRDS